MWDYLVMAANSMINQPTNAVRACHWIHPPVTSRDAPARRLG